SQRLLDVLLDDAGEWPGAEQAVVALLGQPAAGTVGKLDEDLAVGQLNLELGHELVHHLAHAFGAEIGELDGGVETIAELGRKHPVYRVIVLVMPRLAAE